MRKKFTHLEHFQLETENLLLVVSIYRLKLRFFNEMHGDSMLLSIQYSPGVDLPLKVVLALDISLFNICGYCTIDRNIYFQVR